MAIESLSWLNISSKRAKSSEFAFTGGIYESHDRQRPLSAILCRKTHRWRTAASTAVEIVAKRMGSFGDWFWEQKKASISHGSLAICASSVRDAHRGRRSARRRPQLRRADQRIQHDREKTNSYASLDCCLCRNLVFLLCGRSLLSYLGVTVHAFAISGGILLFVAALADAVRPSARPASSREHPTALGSEKISRSFRWRSRCCPVLARSCCSPINPMQILRA